MQVNKVLKTYIDRMLRCYRSHKVLYLDTETRGIIAQLLSQTEALANDVFLIQQLGVSFSKGRALSSAGVSHMAGIVYVRPTEANIKALVDELRKPQHSRYFLFFSQQLEESSLQRLAQADVNERVESVFELYADYFPVNPDFWTLNIEHQCRFHKNDTLSTNSEMEAWDRQLQGLAAFLLSVKKNPLIRYQQSSRIAHKLARDLSSHIEHESELFGWTEPSNKPLLLILDRKEDAITPLLSQWTYQAMVHELLGINNSRVKLSNSSSSSSSSSGDERKYDDEKKKEDDTSDASRNNEVVLNPFNDEFFDENLESNYGEIADKTQKRVQAFAKKRSSTKGGMRSIEDMQRFVENYPEFLAEQGSVGKHLSVVSALKDEVSRRKLLEISILEQEMVCDASLSSMSKHFSRLDSVIRNPNVQDFDKLRIVLIYVLRYEKKLKETDLSKIRSLLRDNCDQLQSNDIQLIQAMIRFYGNKQRQSQLFAQEKGGLFGKIGSMVKSQVTDVECVYTQHDPLLDEILDHAVSAKLNITDYPSISGRFNSEASPSDVIVFMVGGATYEEALCVRRKNQSHRGTNFVLGCPYIYNAKSFISDVKSVFVTQTDSLARALG